MFQSPADVRAIRSVVSRWARTVLPTFGTASTAQTSETVAAWPLGSRVIATSRARMVWAFSLLKVIQPNPEVFRGKHPRHGARIERRVRERVPLEPRLR